ncbi:hypothetical protein FE257_002457 [Aspergillus nanangensis]|uniref:Uncharacterized protein n=1 Tax=Aspergillus nanangensis TaxID=2582783 RepID=A0AAD4CSS0_ASPNN|nr:hypothetical protein FE257_002457 [Aspergillus nanangensis]
MSRPPHPPLNDCYFRTAGRLNGQSVDRYAQAQGYTPGPGLPAVFPEAMDRMISNNNPSGSGQMMLAGGPDIQRDSRNLARSFGTKKAGLAVLTNGGGHCVTHEQIRTRPNIKNIREVDYYKAQPKGVIQERFVDYQPSVNDVGRQREHVAKHGRDASAFVAQGRPAYAFAVPPARGDRSATSGRAPLEEDLKRHENARDRRKRLQKAESAQKKARESELKKRRGL